MRTVVFILALNDFSAGVGHLASTRLFSFALVSFLVLGMDAHRVSGQ